MSATYDTLAIASRDSAAQVENSCKHCIFVHAHHERTAAGRYAALKGLVNSTQWKASVAGKYDYIYFPEEEVVQTVHSVNRYVLLDLCREAKGCRHVVLVLLVDEHAIASYSI